MIYLCWKKKETYLLMIHCTLFKNLPVCLSASLSGSVSFSVSSMNFVNPTFRQPCPFPLLPLPNPTRFSSFLWGCFEHAESLRGMISISFRILKTFCRTYNLVTLVSTDITRPVDHQTFAWQTDWPTNRLTNGQTWGALGHLITQDWDIFLVKQDYMTTQVTCGWAGAVTNG